MHVITGYVKGDSYVTVVSKSVCTVAMSAADLPISTRGIFDRQITVASKDGVAFATSPAEPDLHYALVDSTTSRVLVVHNESSDQQIVTGNPVRTPVWKIFAYQPV
jgi:hypothetical protein